MSDLATKYQKLAAEYAKLRAQVPVLKKAVIDEQQKSQDLQENVKEKDQTIRKCHQEIESLTFRNQQLSTRVTFLQEELEHSGSKSTKKNKMLQVFKLSPSRSADAQQPSASNSTNIGVIGEELQSKIEENARLHSKVFEVDLEYQQTVSSLRERLYELETEAGKHQQRIDTLTAESKATIDKLTNDKVTLQVELHKRDQQTKSCLSRTEEAELKMEELKQELGDQLTQANLAIQQRLCFNDCKNNELTALNIPVYDRQHQLQARELISQASSLIQDFTQCLSNFYTYTEQRVQVYSNEREGEPLSDTNQKFCQYLRENASHLRLVEQTFKSFYEQTRGDTLISLDTATGLQEFAKAFNTFVNYATKIQPYYSLSIEEECSLSTCTASLQEKNMAFHASLQTFVDSLTTVNSYLQTIVAQCDVHTSYTRDNQATLFVKFAESFNTFHEHVKDISKHFNTKVSLEHQLPTITTKVKTTDECLAASLFQLVTNTGKISAFLSGNTSSFTANNTYTNNKIHPAVSDLKAQTAHYIQQVTKPRADTVPYKTAVHNRKTLLSSNESSASLAQQVVDLQAKVTNLEQDKQHWMLESQLIAMKHEKLAEKLRSAEHNLSVLGTQQNGNIEEIVEINGTANGTASSSDKEAPLPSDSAAPRSDDREDLIKSHFTDRIATLTTNLQLADSKALNFSAECRALHKRLLLIYKQKKTLQEQLTNTNTQATKYKDELHTTNRSYEGQLSTMSEHLAGMNEKLTQQKDEIEMLKYQLTNVKGNKRGK